MRGWPLLVLALAACDDKPNATPDPAASASSSSVSASPEPTSRPAKGDGGPFGDFGQFVNEASAALVSAVRGEELDAKFGLEPPDATDKLAGAKRLMTSAEVEAMHDSDGYVRTNVLVFPDGRVLFAEIEHRAKRAYVKPTKGLDKAGPQLLAATNALVSALSGECELPVLTAGDIASLPAALKAEVKDVQPMLDKACAAMKGKGEGWQPRYDDMTVIVDHDGKLRSIKSSIRVSDDKVRLTKPRVR